MSTTVREVHKGQVVDGVPCLGEDLPVNHFHVHVQVLRDGSQVTVPAGIGVGRPWGAAADGFILTGSCFAWIHTHDTSGVIHVFTQVGQPYALGQIFSVWGQPLDASGALGVNEPLKVLVNGRAFDGDPRSVALKNFENIVLELGKPPATPPPAMYDFGTMRR
ncbi:MAG TPA: hypothetical protein VGK28_08075 [Candidatus Dormibacteraeota bacterium]